MKPARGHTALRGDRDGFFAGEILAGDGFRDRHDLLRSAAGNDLTASGTRTGSYVHDVIRGAHGILVVLDNDDCVPHVTQIFERMQELVIVALVKAYAGLVQDVADADETGADLGRQADALGLAAGESGRRARQGQIIESHVIEEADAGADLLEHLPADEFLCLRELKSLQELLQFFY